MKKRHLFLSLLFLAVKAQAETEESVLVLGQKIKEERAKTSRTGQSVLIQPDEASRFDASSQLRLESSLTFVETGRISPSGFVIPKIRGQDSKLTDIYLEDILLSDPYSGLPLVEDLDLRAFGALELHQGASPIAIPSANSVGVLRYRFQHAPKSRATLGLVTGSPYGNSLWGLGIAKGEGQEFRLYGRLHQTSGRYSYYSDQATPYNASDDREKTRLNNDQRSAQIMPVYRANFGAYDLQALAWLHQANRGIPSGSPVLSSNARDLTRGRLADVSLGRNWDDLESLEHMRISLHLGRNEDERETIDPEKLVLNSSKEAKMTVTSNRQGLRGNFDFGPVQSYLTLEEAQSEIKQKYQSITGLSLDRSNETLIWGLGYNPWPALTLEGKLSSQRQWDELGTVNGVVLAEEHGHETRYRFSRGESFSAALGRDLGLYAQISRSRRLPSLYEEFGNGNTIRPNDKLQPEQLFHREIGAFYRASHLRVSAAYYRDRTDDKIVVVPILASASKALNIAATEISGIDGDLSLGIASSLFTVKASLVKAEDKSAARDRKIPGVPDKILIAEWRQSWLETFSTHLNARYRSEVYRDLGNTVKLPGVTTYDGNIDLKLGRYELGLALRNIFDTKHVPIESGTSRGETGISDIAGSPLPGRQWIFSLISTWD